MKTKNILSLALCCLLLVSSVGTCLAQSYQMEEQQRERLQAIFNQLELNLQEQDRQLKIANESLAKSEEQIKISNNQINLLDNQLKVANQSISQATNSLEKVNKSFQAYQEQTKSEIRKTRLQRDILVVGMVAMLFKK